MTNAYLVGFPRFYAFHKSFLNSFHRQAILIYFIDIANKFETLVSLIPSFFTANPFDDHATGVQS